MNTLRASSPSAGSAKLWIHAIQESESMYLFLFQASRNVNGRAVGHLLRPGSMKAMDFVVCSHLSQSHS